MDDATQKLVGEAPAWIDRHGDVWIFRDGMGWSFETQPFTREHIEKKWGPLVPLAAQRPPVGPEVQKMLADLIDKQLNGDAGYGVGEYLARAILARFSLPVLDVEKVQAELDRHEYDGSNLCTCGESMGGSSDGVVWTVETNGHLARALIAALPTLTREGANE